MSSTPEDIATADEAPNMAPFPVEIDNQNSATQSEKHKDTSVDVSKAVGGLAGLNDGNTTVESITSNVSAASSPTFAKETTKNQENRQEDRDSEEVIRKAQNLVGLVQAGPMGLVHITIPSGKEFTLHIDVLVEKCGYFRAALTGNFRESSTKQLTLFDVSDKTFGFFLKWLYRGHLRPTYDPNRRPQTLSSLFDLAVPSLFELWFFADYLRAPALQNHIITDVVKRFENYSLRPTDEQLTHIFDCIQMLWTPKERTDHGELAKPLRTLLLDYVANPRYMDQAKAEKLIETGPASFIREHAIATVKRDFYIEPKTDDIEGVLSVANEFSEYMFNPSESDWEYMVLRVDDATHCMYSLRSVWKIRPEKYFVKETKKVQEKKWETVQRSSG